MPLWEGRGSKSRTRESQFPREIKPLAIVITSITKNGPYAWGNFHACALTKFQKPQQLGRARADSVLVDQVAEPRASPSPISADCCMQAVAETTAADQPAKKT